MGKSLRILGLFIIVIISVIVIYHVIYHQVFSVLYPEEYARDMERSEQRQLEFEQRELIKEERERQEQLEIQKQLAEQEKLEIQKQLAEQEKLPILTESGRLKYRPYWLVSDKWDNMEIEGLIEKSEGCADLVSIIYVTLDEFVKEEMFNLWKQECVRGQ